MKIKNKDIIEFYNSNLILTDKKLPVRLSHAIAVNDTQLQPAMDAYMKERRKLLNEYCEKDERGEILIRDEKAVFRDEEGWLRAASELIDAETEIVITTIPFSILEKCDEEQFDKLTSAEISAIEFMIEQEG